MYFLSNLNLNLIQELKYFFGSFDISIEEIRIQVRSCKPKKYLKWALHNGIRNKHNTSSDKETVTLHL